MATSCVGSHYFSSSGNFKALLNCLICFLHGQSIKVEGELTLKDHHLDEIGYNQKDNEP
jgi:hypothetical protein